MVVSQYMGTIRTRRSTMKRRQPSARPRSRRDETIMMKPLMTKNRSTPPLPVSSGAEGTPARPARASMCTKMTMKAARARRAWTLSRAERRGGSAGGSASIREG